MISKQVRDLIQEVLADKLTLLELTQVVWILHNYDEEKMALLDALEQCGVENWEGYQEALKLMEEWR